MTQLDDQITKRSERISLRLDPEADEVLREAASLEHKTLSAFMLAAALEKAELAVDRHRRLILPAVEFNQL